MLMQEAPKLSIPETANRIDLPDADVWVMGNFIESSQADEIFESARSEIPWQQESLKLYGKMQKVPRLVSWHGDAGASYRYSGVVHEPKPWVSSLRQIRDMLRMQLQVYFNAVLANLYQTGSHYMGWHSDAEPEMGPNPVIASVTLGAERPFKFRHRQDHTLQHKMNLSHGSLLIMAGTTQKYWQHSLPRSTRPFGPRVNMTFRIILAKKPAKQDFKADLSHSA